MDFIKLNVGDRVIMRKQHPCGCALFEIERTGVDIRMHCTGCGRVIMAPREQLLKKIKSVAFRAPTDVGNEE